MWTPEDETMFITWKPGDGEPDTKYEFDPEDVLNSEAMRIEKAYGGEHSFDQWLQAIQKGEGKARRVLLWHLMCTKAPRLQFKDVPDFRRRQLVVEMSVVELQTMKAKIDKMPLDEDTKEQIRMAFDVDLREAMERETGVYEGDIVEEPANLPKAQ